MDLQGKTALVTGGAVRIGRAICTSLAAAGANVVIHYSRSKQHAMELQSALTGVKAYTVQGDLASEAGCRAVMSKAGEAAGRLDVLVNNAAVFHKDNLMTATARIIEEEFWPNLFAPMLLMRLFAEQCGSGAVVNLLDRRITSMDTDRLQYVLTKKALAELTRMAALELAPRIRVNGIAPGSILPPPGKGLDYIKDHAGPVPLRKQLTPEDVAEGVLVLLRNDALTGQILYVDGGQNLLGTLPTDGRGGLTDR